MFDLNIFNIIGLTMFLLFIPYEIIESYYNNGKIMKIDFKYQTYLNIILTIIIVLCLA